MYGYSYQVQSVWYGTERYTMCTLSRLVTRFITTWINSHSSMSAEATSDTTHDTISEKGFDVQLVEALADATGRPLKEIPPLYESIDLDALTTLIADCESEIRVQFEHIGYTVSIECGSITVADN